MSRRYVGVTRTYDERRVPSTVSARKAVEALMEHLGLRIERRYARYGGVWLEVVQVDAKEEDVR